MVAVGLGATAAWGCQGGIWGAWGAPNPKTPSSDGCPTAVPAAPVGCGGHGAGFWGAPCLPVEGGGGRMRPCGTAGAGGVGGNRLDWFRSRFPPPTPLPGTGMGGSGWPRHRHRHVARLKVARRPPAPSFRQEPRPSPSGLASCPGATSVTRHRALRRGALRLTGSPRGLRSPPAPGDAGARLPAAPCPRRGAGGSHPRHGGGGGGGGGVRRRGALAGQQQQQRGPGGAAGGAGRAPPGPGALVPAARAAGDRGVGAHIRPRPARHRGGGGTVGMGGG